MRRITPQTIFWSQSYISVDYIWSIITVLQVTMTERLGMHLRNECICYLMSMCMHFSVSCVIKVQSYLIESTQKWILSSEKVESLQIVRHIILKQEKNQSRTLFELIGFCIQSQVITLLTLYYIPVSVCAKTRNSS